MTLIKQENLLELYSEKNIQPYDNYKKRVTMISNELRDFLISEHIDLPKKVAYMNKNYGVDVEDLAQEGTLGLLHALDKFDPSKCETDDREELSKMFGTYAYSWVKSKIYEYVMSNMHITKIATTKGQKKAFFNIRKHKTDDRDRWFTKEEVEHLAELYDISTNDIYTIEKRFNNTGSDVYYMHQANHTKGDEAFSKDYNECLVDEFSNVEQLLSETEYRGNMLKSLHNAVKKLPERNKDIITKRYLNDEKIGLKELGEQYNISAERVRQIEVATLKKLQNMIDK